MGIIPKVKCSRCEKSYSGLQSKCPYCGARRSKGGKFSMPRNGDPRWRLAVGVLLLVAILCTVVALANINSTTNNTAQASPSASPSSSGVSPSASGTDADSTPSDAGATPSDAGATPSDAGATTSDAGAATSDAGITPSDAGATPSDAGASPSVSGSIESISVQWDYYKGTSEMTISTGDSVALKAVVYPTTADVTVTWKSEDTSVCTVDASGNIKAVGSGKTNIIAEYNGVQGTLVVRVK